MKTGIIDRFEKGIDNDFAIIELETREILIIEKNLLPDTAKEGDNLELDEFNNILNH